MSVSMYACSNCGAQFGITGGSGNWTSEDYAAQEYFDAQVEYHETRQCPARLSLPAIRKDGKTRRASRLGLPPSRHDPLQLRDGEKHQSWHELVQPGPKGDPKKTLARAEAQAAKRTPKMLLENPMLMPRDARRRRKGRGYNPGRLVLHRTATTARSGGGINRAADRARRRAEREANQ